MKTANVQQKKKRRVNKNHPGTRPSYPGYQEYPPDEDIYRKEKEDTVIDPEDINEKKIYRKKGMLHENDFHHDESGSELDVPGSELDDDMEDNGSEDEENNFYSMSDENYDDLEDILDR